ncbi:inorganic phosphate transporter [Streptosporangium sp. NBC_01639]|uniref:inorganic phosphate transporter n=1 Tax=Streptosporangium sp. NBC_01639 TaxID=2975948 RepID=UPI003870608B|nr:inorganic phosphate transporter [Streptosporangium sp. NBC_01639]
MEVGMVVAAVFAVFTGFNDAGAQVGLGTRARGLPPLAALALLATAVAVAPLVVGTAVAATLDGRLVAYPGGDGRTGLYVGVAVAVAVTVGLGWRGLPTSLTLALVGGIAGAGTGGGGDVSWPVIASVLAAAAAAPVAGALVAGAACRLVRGLPHVGTAGIRLRWLHIAAFSAGCVAYGANDGQKVLAVYFATRDGTRHGAADLAPVLVLLGVCFLAGGLAGLPRLAAGLGGMLTPTRTDTLVATELTGASVVLGTAALGSPVSMTQSLAGALIGTGLARGTRRVRWRGVLALGRAWLFTLPLAYGLAALANATIGALS